jgi:hypothetical protein
MLNDIKYNRTGAFKYYNGEFKEVSDVIISRIYNVIKWFISGKMGRSTIYVNVPIIVSELVLSKKISLKN